jgi:hypothetical protein
LVVLVSDQGNFIPAKDLATSLLAHGLPLPPGLASVPGVSDRLTALAGKQIGAYVREAPREAKEAAGGGAGGAVGNGGGGGDDSGGCGGGVDRSARLGIGRLLGEALDGLAFDAEVYAAARPLQETAASGTVGRGATLRLVSGHDTTLVPLLSALGAYDGRWPPYSSFVSFELWDLGDGNTPPSPPSPEGREEGLDGGSNLAVRVVFNGAPVRLPGLAPLLEGGGEAGATSGATGGKVSGEAGAAAGPLYALSAVRALVAPLVPQDRGAECTPIKALPTMVGGGDKF